MSYFSNPPKLSIVYPNPLDSSRPLFYVFDSVHLLKCIRNNWINQKSPRQSLFFPEFNSSDIAVKMLTASFYNLKKMHELETGGLLKYSFGLTLKALSYIIRKAKCKISIKSF